MASGICRSQQSRLRFLWKKSPHKDRLHAITYRRHSTQASPAISYVSARSDYSLVGSTLGQLLDEQVEKTPDKEMVVYSESGVRMTYGQFKKKMDDLSAGLLSLDLKPGDRVGIWSPNRVEWTLAQFATAQLGMILVNINPAYRVNELEYALHKVGVSCLIMAEKLKTSNYYEMLFEVCPELARCAPGHLHSHRLPQLRSVIKMGEERKPGVFLLDEVLELGKDEHRTDISEISSKLHFDQPINIQFTSGTTGNPKGATLTHHNIVNNARFVGLRMNYHNQPDAKICVPVPLYHCFGMVCGSLQNIVTASTVVYPSESFDPVACLRSIQEEKCTVVYGTPTMFIDILNVPNFDEFDVSSLNSGIMAGSPCPVEVMKQVNNKLDMPQACVAYGSTESSPVVFLTFPDDSIEKRCGSIGAALDHTEAKIIDDSGEIVPRGETGELCTRGYSTMLGYWEDKTKTDSAISSTQWYHTGDLASMDEDGYVMINGRIKDMIIRGGENIYPVEVEQYLYKHPAIEDVQIVGLPDKRMGEEVCAAIRVKEGITLTEQEVKDFCKGNMAHFKIPRYIVFVDSFPLTVTGKVQKFIMRQELVKQLNLEHEAP